MISRSSFKMNFGYYLLYFQIIFSNFLLSPYRITIAETIIFTQKPLNYFIHDF